MHPLLKKIPDPPIVRDRPMLLDCTTSHLRLVTKHSSHCKQRLVLLWHYELASLDDELVSAKRLKAQFFDAL